jgi:S1-C subfamily serine protease
MEITRVARWLALAVAVGLALAACGVEETGALEAIPGTTNQQLITERDNPAIMLIITEWKATLSVPTLGYNNANLQALTNYVVAQARSGQISSDTKTLLDTFVKGIAASPNSYFTAVAPITQKAVTAFFQCTGSIVTPDGYIVTAAHCTSTSTDTRYRAYVENGLVAILTAAKQKFLADNPGFDADQQKILSDAVASFLADQSSINAETKSIITALFSFSSSGQRTVSSAPVQVVTQGNAPPKSSGPFGDKDVSILKLDGYTDLPTVPVGSETTVESGQPIYIDGYPVLAESGNLNNLSTPTVTSGTISAKKTSDLGVPLLETATTTTGGNSGGPALNDKGEMVGIVSYGISQTGASYNYLIGASVVQQFLHEKNITPKQGRSTTIYNTALNNFHLGYYKWALPEFQQVKALYPGHPYVDAFIQRTQKAIQEGSDKTPALAGTGLVLAWVGGIGAVLVGAAVAAFVILTMRRRSRRAVVTSARGVTMAAAPAFPPPSATTAATPEQALSADGRWRWDGQAWVPTSAPPPAPPGVAAAVPAPTAMPSPPIPPPPPPPAAAEPAPAPAEPATSSSGPGPSAAIVSADGLWRWDGQAWVPNTPPPPGSAAP